MWLLQCRGEWKASTDVYDSNGGNHGRNSGKHSGGRQTNAGLPVNQRLGDRSQWAYDLNKTIPMLNGPDEMDWKFDQKEADRVQEFRSCIECMLCVNTCHVMREHQLWDEFAGPRFFVRLANLEMHPMDQDDSRLAMIKDDYGLGYCNITRCCTEVCPAGINITDNAIIPLKERVVTEYYDPITMIAKKLGLRK